MWRLVYFWKGHSLSAKLQYLAMGLLLGWTFVRIDLNNRFMGLPMWQVTVSMIVATFVLGRVLLPLLMLNPQRSQRLLSWFGMLIFLMGLYIATQPWRGKKVVHLALTEALWLDVSCWFWLISEIQMRLTRPVLASAGSDDDNNDLNYDDKDDGR